MAERTHPRLRARRVSLALSAVGLIALILGACAVTPPAGGGGVTTTTLGGGGTTTTTPGGGGGTTTTLPGGSTTPTLVAGRQHTCSLRPNATVRCWGNNSLGQLGNGSLIGSNIPVAVTVPD